MFANSWSIALLVCSGAALFLAGGAVTTGIRVLRYWDASADTSAQIRLESETWLSALLMQYGLLLQITSLFLLVLAADSYAKILVGAMCATGAFLANEYGMPLLLLKVAGIFIYGFWVLLHKFDISSEFSPLIRHKYIYLLSLVPLLILDGTLLVLYLSHLEPDIITSCCGVVFGNSNGDGNNLIGPMPVQWVLSAFYSMAGLLVVFTILLLKRLKREQTPAYRTGSVFYAFFWLLFFIFSLVVITTVISSYIYSMPSHRCPFDILKMEYGGVGYSIYMLLFVAVFLGMSGGWAAMIQRLPGLEEVVYSHRKRALQVSLVLLLLFLVLITWFPATYLLCGGEC